MTPYDKTIWINDETYLDEDNMNKIEEQLEILTNNLIELKNENNTPLYHFKSNSVVYLQQKTIQNLSEDKAILGNIITDAYSRGFNTIILDSIFSETPTPETSTILEIQSKDIQTKPTNFSFIDGGTFKNYTYQNNTTRSFSLVNLSIQGSWEENVFTVTSATIETYPYDFLTMDNTYPYQPENLYHPATKKYVDDSIENAIGTALGGSY